MARFSLSSIRVRLFFFVIIAILPLLGVTLYTAAEGRQQAAVQAQEETLNLVHQASDEQERLIEGAHQLLEIMAQLPAVLSNDSPACTALFGDLLERNPFYANIGLIRPDGELLCSAIPASEPINLADRPYFQIALKSYEFAIGDYQVGRITGKPTLHLGYPVLNDAGQVQAVLYVALDMTWLNRLTSQAELPPGATLTLIDRNGTVLSCYPDAEKWVGKSALQVPVIQTILNRNGEGTVESTGGDGIKRLYAFSTISSTDIYLFSGIPTKVVFADANKNLVLNLTVLGLVIALVLFIAWMVGNQLLLLPVNKLLNATRRLAENDLGARTGLPYGQGELGQLAHAFDEMAGELEQRTNQLHDNEKRLRLITDNILDMLLLTDAGFIIQYASPAYKRCLGVAPEDLIGVSIFERVHPDDLADVMAAVEVALKNKSGGRAVYRLRHADGYYLWFESNGNPLLGRNSNITGAVFVNRDVTERKMMEEELEKLSHQKEMILSSAGEGVFGLDLQGRITFVNPAAARMLGYEVDELIGCSSQGTYHHSKPDGSPYPEEECPIYVTYKDMLVNHIADEVFWRKDGASFPVEYVSTPIRERGKLVGAVVVFKDITKHKEAEVVIQRKLAFEETIARISSRFVGVLNMDDAILASLADMGILSRVSRAYLIMLREDKRTMDNTHEWCSEGVSPQCNNLQNLSSEMFPWWISKLLKGETIKITDVSEMPPEAKAEQELLESLGIKSTLVVTLNVRGELAGFIGFDNMVEKRVWGSDDLVILRVYSEIMGSAIEHKQAENRIRSDAARAGVLAEVSQALAEVSLDYWATLETVAQLTARFIGDTCVITLLSDDGQWLNPVAFHNPTPEVLDLLRNIGAIKPVPVDGGFLGRIVKTAQPLIIPFVTPEQAAALVHPEYYPYLKRYDIYSIMAVPLRADGRVIGVLALMRNQPGRSYSPDDQAFSTELANRVALAITNARLFNDNKRQLQSLGALYTSSRKLGQSLDHQELNGDITRTCVEVFGVRLACIARAETDGSIRFLKYYPPENSFPQQISVRWDDSTLGQGTIGRAIHNGSTVTITDIITDPNFAPWREAALEQGFCCAAAFPLISRNKPIGGMVLYSDKPGFFTNEQVEFFQSYAQQAAVALENARLFEEAERRLKHVQSLRSIDMAITGSLDIRVVFEVVLEQVVEQLNIHAADILMLNPYTQTLEYAAGRGFRSRAIEDSHLRLGKGYAGRAVLEKRIISVANLPEDAASFKRPPLLVGEDFIAYYGVPLIAKGQVKGLLEIFHRAPLDPDPEWLEFLETLAGQAAIAIDNAMLFESMQRSNIELTLAYDATIEGLSFALDLRDKETEGHSKRVAEMTVRLARFMGINEDKLVHIRRGALLHDIGKLGVPDNILLKQGPLTDEERVIMRQHPAYAYEMLSPIEHLRPALDIPYCHHEKLDGTGFPRGLRSEQIPLAARIFTVVDVWDALLSDRPYRSAWPKDKVREYIREQAGKHFDPKIVKVFLEME